MTMNTVLDTYTLLADAVRDDPFLLLANAVAWCDPLWAMDADDMETEDDGLGIALAVTRQAFPDIYAGAVERIRAGESAAALDRFICGEITGRGIPLDNLEFMSYGIPLDAAGALLEDPDFYEQHPDVLPILAFFGVHPEAGMYSVEVPDAAYTAGRAAADSLMNQGDEHWRQVGWALAWLFSCSGNSVIDLDYESLMDIPPLSWEPNDVAFAVDLIEEANGIMADVNAGLQWLETTPAAMAQLEGNLRRIFRKLKTMKGKQRDDLRIALEWRPVGDSDGGTALADPEFLHVRGDAA
ncbi:MAG: hypothetical protein SF029_09155 [bacterium]|nr:hypothetical protein [bacterium]